MPSFSFLSRTYSWKATPNGHVVLPILVVVSIGAGSLFYFNYNGWTAMTSFYYATQALMGCMYGVPAEVRPRSKLFTLMFFMWGLIIIAGALGDCVLYFVGHVSDVASQQRAAAINSMSNVDRKGSGGYLKQFLGWDRHYLKYLSFVAAMMWLVIGTAYGLLYEKQTLNASIYFAFGAMVSSGVPPPSCDGPDPSNCDIGTFRGMFISIYIFVGIPLFALFLTQIGSFFAERSIRKYESEILHMPLSESEFIHATAITRSKETKRVVLRSMNNNNTIAIDSCGVQTAEVREDIQIKPTNHQAISFSLSEFIVLELLRLRRMTNQELIDIKDIYDSIGETHHIYLDKSVSNISQVQSDEMGQLSVEPEATSVSSVSGVSLDQRGLNAFTELVVGIRRERSSYNCANRQNDLSTDSSRNNIICTDYSQVLTEHETLLHKNNYNDGNGDSERLLKVNDSYRPHFSMGGLANENGIDHHNYKTNSAPKIVHGVTSYNSI